MTADQKSLWNEVKADLKDRSSPLSAEMLARIDAAMTPVYALKRTFEAERQERLPFFSQAKCPICGVGTVTCQHKAPLIGSMKCDTPDCIVLHL